MFQFLDGLGQVKRLSINHFLQKLSKILFLNCSGRSQSSVYYLVSGPSSTWMAFSVSLNTLQFVRCYVRKSCDTFKRTFMYTLYQTKCTTKEQKSITHLVWRVPVSAQLSKRNCPPFTLEMWWRSATWLTHKLDPCVNTFPERRWH